jgi:hypothetical protein
METLFVEFSIAEIDHEAVSMMEPGLTEPSQTGGISSKRIFVLSRSGGDEFAQRERMLTKSRLFAT